MTPLGAGTPDRPAVPGFVWIKICGIRDRDAALAAVEAGADALGFVFAPSPRRIDPDAAARIVAAVRGRHPASDRGDRVRPPASVGVFVDAPMTEMVAIARHVGLTHIQLHGDEPESVVAALQEQGFGVIRAVATQVQGVAAPVPSLALTTRADRVLLDAAVPGRRGGTGRLADWAVAARLARRRPVILAGGLNPDNVAEAIRVVRPWGVDVSSGVERARGVKDPERIARFVAAARAAAEMAGCGVTTGSSAAGGGSPADGGGAGPQAGSVDASVRPPVGR
ncbi:MAG TPA: phosphoribosylanthranilate isomerase [Thermaerobacter sp.]